MTITSAEIQQAVVRSQNASSASIASTTLGVNYRRHCVTRGRSTIYYGPVRDGGLRGRWAAPGAVSAAGLLARPRDFNEPLIRACYNPDGRAPVGYTVETCLAAAA